LRWLMITGRKKIGPPRSLLLVTPGAAKR